MDERRDVIVRELRELVHAITESVGSGRLGFDFAFKEYIEQCESSLARAFSVYIPAMGLGSETSRQVPIEMEQQIQTTRRNTLRQIAQSVDVSEVTEFVEALIRSQDEKISLVRTLMAFEERLKDN